MLYCETEWELFALHLSGRTPEELLPSFRNQLFYKELNNAVTDGLQAKLISDEGQKSFCIYFVVVLLVVFCCVGFSLLRVWKKLLPYISPITNNLGPVHTTTPEEFEIKRGFHSEKSSNVFHSHYAGEISKRNNNQSFWICVWGKLGQRNHITIVMLSFWKSPVLGRPSRRNKVAFSNCSGVVWTLPWKYSRRVYIQAYIVWCRLVISDFLCYEHESFLVCISFLISRFDRKYSRRVYV